MIARNVLLSLFLYTQLLLPLAYGVPVATTASDNPKVLMLQNELKRLQSELESLQSNNVPNTSKQSATATDQNVQTNSVLIGKHPVQEEEMGKLRPAEQQPSGFFYDRPVKISKRLYERRQIGLQPLRSVDTGLRQFRANDGATGFQPLRSIGFQPLRAAIQDDPPPFKRAQPRLQISLDDDTDVRQDVISAVEQHLLEDLDAAKAYGIRPEEILQNLRQKQKAAPADK